MKEMCLAVTAIILIVCSIAVYNRINTAVQMVYTQAEALSAIQ